MNQSKISQAAANLFPGYFALVMATGIVSIAAKLLGQRAHALFERFALVAEGQRRPLVGKRLGDSPCQ